MKARLLVAALALSLALCGAQASWAASSHHSSVLTARRLSDAHVGDSRVELLAQQKFSAAVVARLAGSWQVAPRHRTCWSHVPWSSVCNQARLRLIAHRWLLSLATRRFEALYPVSPDCVGASKAACAWYLDGATQCEVSHEGGFTSVSPYGYAGRFQMDSSFETETPFGRAMENQFGRSSNWPHGAQVQHAFEVWSYSGWGRWPPYYRYGCSAYHGRSYP